MAHLASVPAQPDGKPASDGRTLDVAAAAKTGKHIDLLIAMRDRIAGTVADPDTSARDLAALTKRLSDVAKEIIELEEAERAGSGDTDADDQPLDVSSL